MDSEVQNSRHETLSPTLARITRVLPLLADLARADVLLCTRCDLHTAQVLWHARPHSIASVYKTSITSQRLDRKEVLPLFEVLNGRKYARGSRGHGSSEGAPVEQEAFAIPNIEPDPAAILIETNLLEQERMHRRDKVFQRAIRVIKWMATEGEPEGADTLDPFGEYDGILYADGDRVIRYMSGIATNLYRNIGYTETLIGKPLAYLETQDDDLARLALESISCRQVEIEERGRTWIKKALPICATVRRLWHPTGRECGIVLLLHDDTEVRQRETELEIKTTMIKEVHHRVKNDLQTVAALLRMQSRRMQTEEARGALGEAVNRILSIAVIHEFLSVQDSRIINLRDVAQRILNQMRTAVLDPTKTMQLSLSGPSILMPARQATSCALVVNELLQNALEHGFDSGRESGSISVTFEDEGTHIRLTVHDDGRGLPPEFDLDHVDSLGLRIVRMLVQDDLKGQLEYRSNGGVSAIVRFPKIPFGGEEAWTEPA